MILVPELQKVFILVPRTGSGTLYRELQRVYPKSMLLYRHMEADGVPQGYDHWERIGFVRHPVARLRSFYAFLQTAERVSSSGQVADKTFEEWLLTNDRVFTEPRQDKSGWRPDLSRRDPAPENRRSQFSYLRPDLGTRILHFRDLKHYMVQWGLNPDAVHNSTTTTDDPLSIGASEHFRKFCDWDLHQNCDYL